MKTMVYVVLGHDVGGNGGTQVMAVFDSKPAAERYALDSPHRKDNFAMWWSPLEGSPFEVEGHFLHSSFDDAVVEGEAVLS